MGKPFYPLIGIYKEGTAIGSFIPTLREVFQPRGLVKFGSKKIRDGDFLKQFNLIVLPGVTSEDSPYHELLDAGAVQAMKTGFDAGMSVWMSCAAAYQSAACITYNTPYKQVQDLPGIALFGGEAYGPVDGQHPQIDPDDMFSEMRVVRVAFNDSAGKSATTGVCYGNGPGYLPVPGENIEVIARYADAPGNPVAVAGKEIGNGYVMFSGVLPEIALARIPQGMEHDKKRSHIVKLRKGLKPHEAGRRELMRTMAAKFQSRWK